MGCNDGGGGGGGGTATGGLGHHVRAAGFSRPGTLLASWAQPVPTADPACTPFQGGTRSLATVGADVAP